MESRIVVVPTIEPPGTLFTINSQVIDSPVYVAENVQHSKEETVRKRAQSSSSELEVVDGVAIWRKVCIVTRSDMDWFGIYILDLTKKKSCVDFTAISPTIRINCECFFDAAFCVLGSTLYAFQGFDNDWDTPPKERGNDNKSAYIYELSNSPEVCGGLELEEQMMQKISSMHYPKYGTPIAVPTPDGQKILLFSSLIKFDIPLTDKCDFELYNPATDEWKKLPGLSRPPDEYTFFRGIYVHSYTFTKPSVLLIQTDIGLYSLDFGCRKNGRWERFRGWVPGPCGGHFVMIGPELCLTPTHPYVINPHGGGCKRLFYPNFTTYIPHHKITDVTNSITSIPLAEDNFLFCVLQTGIHSTQARLTLDLFTLDLSNCKENLKLRNLRNRNLPGTTIVKSFNFFVENQLPIDRFYPVFFSFIPPPALFFSV